VWAVRTSQETHYVSAAEPSWLMLCGETVAVCCETRTEHTDTLCGQCVPHRRHRYTVWAVRTSHGTQMLCMGSPYLIESTQMLCVGRMHIFSVLNANLLFTQYPRASTKHQNCVPEFEQAWRSRLPLAAEFCDPTCILFTRKTGRNCFMKCSETFGADRM
jgi:hypothetical protein